MKSIKKLLILSGVLFVVILPAHVQAYDFNFTVPVELNNIPKELKNWGIKVTVVDSAHRQIAVGSTFFSVKSNVKKDWPVKFDAKPGKNAASAYKYYVVLLVRSPKLKSYARADRVMISSGPWPYDTKKPVKTASSKNI